MNVINDQSTNDTSIFSHSECWFDCRGSIFMVYLKNIWSRVVNLDRCQLSREIFRFLWPTCCINRNWTHTAKSKKGGVWYFKGFVFRWSGMRCYHTVYFGVGWGEVSRNELSFFIASVWKERQRGAKVIAGWEDLYTQACLSGCVIE